MVRNYKISGEFPVLSTLRGQTFYGGNNDLVANTWRWWGYWVFPNAIPGETPMVELAEFMSEVDVDAYYTQRGKAWIRAHIAGLPRLALGKLTRAYVPVPWKLTSAPFLQGSMYLLLKLARICSATFCQT